MQGNLFAFYWPREIRQLRSSQASLSPKSRFVIPVSGKARQSFDKSLDSMLGPLYKDPQDKRQGLIVWNPKISNRTADISNSGEPWERIPEKAFQKG